MAVETESEILSNLFKCFLKEGVIPLRHFLTALLRYKLTLYNSAI